LKINIKIQSNWVCLCVSKIKEKAKKKVKLGHL
jgi:hypothetical protein